MNRNQKNIVLKKQIEIQYGTYEKFAEKLGYSKHYISNVINGRNPLTSDFREALEVALGDDFIEKNPSKELLHYLFDSSSLRQDLLKQVSCALTDILNNIELTDELCARVKDETYNFIKDYKGVQ